MITPKILKTLLMPLRKPYKLSFNPKI